MAVTALVAIADGSEDLEAVAVIDTLRRGKVDVTVASVGRSTTITAANKTKIVADVLIEDASQTFDLIVLPGGMPGATHLHDSAPLTDKLKQQQKAGRWIGAICAAPAVVLQAHGLLDGRKAVAYPSFAEKLPAGVYQKGSGVVVSNKVVTAAGPGVAVDFGLTLVAALQGAKVAKEVAGGMLTEFKVPSVCDVQLQE
ncbi:DJ-1/PfpI domain-containing protein [Plasmodiophora brassicae]|uniref:DJ-1/PfpI domain-containing protein n=1 Tax=Plasmodiophora brassicae TaxID=37360 RepID=A0A0G4J2Z8_PLABS|nr:hypothetical protein PBRA_002293 [Plasmodiophora brassicae]SPQ98881.1 unnamed protein product [Plasmodiophora brassicae]